MGAPVSLNVGCTASDGKGSLAWDARVILPDLFREGQGVVANGTLVSRDRFEADEVLAKHDETYMPPEVQDALEKAGHPGSKPDAREKDAGYPKGDYD